MSPLAALAWKGVYARWAGWVSTSSCVYYAGRSMLATLALSDYHLRALAGGAMKVYVYDFSEVFRRRSMVVMWSGGRCRLTFLWEEEEGTSITLAR